MARIVWVVWDVLRAAAECIGLAIFFSWAVDDLEIELR
jgi:hypothetical protein